MRQPCGAHPAALQFAVQNSYLPKRSNSVSVDVWLLQQKPAKRACAVQSVGRSLCASASENAFGQDLSSDGAEKLVRTFVTCRLEYCHSFL